MDVTEITYRLEGAVIRSDFSENLQRYIVDLSLQLQDKVLKVYFPNSTDVLSPRACALYPALVWEISTNATLRDRIEKIWLGSWEGGCFYPAVDESLLTQSKSTLDD